MLRLHEEYYLYYIKPLHLLSLMLLKRDVDRAISSSYHDLGQEYMTVHIHYAELRAGFCCNIA